MKSYLNKNIRSKPDLHTGSPRGPRRGAPGLQLPQPQSPGFSWPKLRGLLSPALAGEPRVRLRPLFPRVTSTAEIFFPIVNGHTRVWHQRGLRLCPPLSRWLLLYVRSWRVWASARLRVVLNDGGSVFRVTDVVLRAGEHSVHLLLHLARGLSVWRRVCLSPPCEGMHLVGRGQRCC